MIRSAELWGGLVWLAGGLFVVWSGYDLELGTLSEPGTGFMIFWLGLLLSAFAAVIVGKAVLAGGPTLASLWAGTRWRKIMIVIVALALYAVLFERLGFLVCTLPLLILLMRAIDPVDWKIAIPVALIGSFGIWAVMEKWLKIQLPAGTLWDQLGLV
ncbi:tripartite tricarboxylate transporter TctB family protein [Reyranella sp. CPCC 100927]|uniref:tripartite tricarboxylate transporter TctB family protein n=1 Tax=Reyranella sp. CPCC 100927 TaxID=2599616 RepID=UPI0011B58268|nr:tripartite tricarboxylate transporter TctB family protein [Reyranella sp. CPCC 100927]TWT03164.1 tripartite tricarboxylate transporter TctB family protein [Reyranella sp. CPCC 100927]